jgi:hypothetical protein
MFLRQIRQPLIYPQGMAPGLNLAHPAARGISGAHGLCAVATNNGFISLANGAQGTVSLGTFGSFIQSPIGPAFNWSAQANNQNVVFPGTLINDLSATLAIIGTDVAGTGAYMGTDFSTETGGWRLDDTTLTAPFAGSVSSGLTPPLSVPILYVASINAAQGLVRFMTVNLLTGALVTATVSSGGLTPIVPGSATLWIGGCPAQSTNSIQGSVSAAMFSPTPLSMAQMLAWGADPWSFWYPPSVLMSYALARKLVVTSVKYRRLDVRLRR